MDNYSLSGFAHHPINQRGKKRRGVGEKKGNPTTCICKQKTLSNLTVVINSLLGIIHGNNVLVLEAG